jgi:hypothetical protein
MKQEDVHIYNKQILFTYIIFIITMFFIWLNQISYAQKTSPLTQTSDVLNLKTDHSLLVHVQHCGQDLFEPNNVRRDAKNISMHFKQGRDVEAHMCRHDVDWFSFWLSQGQLIEITLDSTHESIMPSMSIFAPRKRKASGIVRRRKYQKSLKVYAKRSGRYRLKVSSHKNFTERYILRMRDLRQ